MILPDVNLLVYAFRREDDRHAVYSAWLQGVVDGGDELALHDPVLSGFVRVVTHPRIMKDPAPMRIALGFVARLRVAPRARWISSGPDVWLTLGRLVEEDTGIRANLVPDASLAATAIAHGCRLATADRGFARYPGLRWFDPAGGLT